MLLRQNVLAILISCLCLASCAAADGPWPAVTLADAQTVEMAGPLGQALSRGIARLEKPPYTEQWLRADVSFEMERIFTNYSGDASGRFLELAALTSPRGRREPAVLTPLLATIPRQQKPDGHFGASVDLSKPLAKGSAPIPMLWGNARLLVGLLACAERFGDPQALRAARRLGDFYVSSAEQLCTPAREAEYRASGTYGDSYTCCYFPAIEGLAMLYEATRDDRYLKTARRIADFFARFDALPVDHSHGNLCAWRGILMLYRLTGERRYLDGAVEKWQKAMADGYVWPIGGIGEHWYTAFGIDEGCSESDWLRFNLELWRWTGQARYLDVAERLLVNQYAANQVANGGYGARHFDCDATGPVGTAGRIEEWPFCCNFHGPLGLYFLKSYLAAGSRQGVVVNFPIDFRATVLSDGRTWQVNVRHITVGRIANPDVGRIANPSYENQTTYGSKYLSRSMQPTVEIELAARGAAAPTRTTLWLRVPDWARGLKVQDSSGVPIVPVIADGYARIQREFQAGKPIVVALESGLAVERRRFRKPRIEPGRTTRLRNVTLLAGPEVLVATAPGGRPTLLATVDSAGRLELPDPAGATVLLPNVDVEESAAASALQSGRPVLLRPWSAVTTIRRVALTSDLLVLPRDRLDAKVLANVSYRAAQASAAGPAPIFGDHLEKCADLWPANPGWKFTPQGILVSDGDVGLADGQGYADYRFEFDLLLPKEGAGIAGWVVRAASEDHCLMFQLQSADSTFSAPQFKTRPNTLRPHLRHEGAWTILDPIALPEKILRGQSHHVGVECCGRQVDVSLDGRKVYSQQAADHRTGGVGFRAAGPAEQGLFSNITLRR
ncbi:MAG: beta-L-arabinofuranosidase domain-containing protein [Thermoguttaceae bacterium]|jgi:DUF1680 family protein